MSLVRFHSSDAGSPVINGLTGNGVPNLLDICLVGAGTAYGSKPKMGWTKAFTGTNKGVYVTVNGVCSLRVAQDGTNTGGFREAIVRAAEGASDVDTLVDPFPLVAEVSDANATWRTSDTLDSTAREWELVAGPNHFALSVVFGTGRADTYLFGKPEGEGAGNAWPYIITLRGVSNNTGDGTASGVAQAGLASFNTLRMYAMRSVDGITKAPRAALVTPSASSVSGGGPPGQSGPPIPDADGQIDISMPEVWVNGATGGTAVNPRAAGFFPNLWSTRHNFFSTPRGAVYGDTFTSLAYDLDAVFVLRGPAGDTGGKWAIETTDTWAVP
jgi:hypothetical protein